MLPHEGILLWSREILAIASIIYAWRTTKRIGWSIKAAAILFIVEATLGAVLRTAMLAGIPLGIHAPDFFKTGRELANFLGVFFVFRAVDHDLELVNTR